MWTGLGSFLSKSFPPSKNLQIYEICTKIWRRSVTICGIWQEGEVAVESNFHIFGKKKESCKTKQNCAKKTLEILEILDILEKKKVSNNNGTCCSFFTLHKNIHLYSWILGKFSEHSSGWNSFLKKRGVHFQKGAYCAGSQLWTKQKEKKEAVRSKIYSKLI